jgi:hypothetical protein
VPPPSTPPLSTAKNAADEHTFGPIEQARLHAVVLRDG